MTDLGWADAVETARLVRSGDASPAEAVDAAIERIEKLDGEINAVIHPLFDRARACVASLPADAPFRGVPMVVKDYDGTLAGAPLHMGNAALANAGHTATTTSALFTRLERAGFVIVGKTNTPEFGLLPVAEPTAKGATRNPWNTGHSTGGSSGGSAAAVAAGMVPIAHAGDGGGSIRIPASECGLFGLKPSRGRISLGPDEGEDWAGLVARHVITRTVRDSAAVLDLLEGPEVGDPYAAPSPARAYADEVGASPGRLRIGVRYDATGGLCEVDPVCRAATEQAAALLADLGHDVEEASPVALDQLELAEHFTTVVHAHARADVEMVGRLLGREVTADDFERYTWDQAESGRGISAAAYVQAVRGLHSWTRDMSSWWADGFDMLLTPTLASPPPPIGWLYGDLPDPNDTLARAIPLVIFTLPFNVTGQPAASIPWSWTDDDLPIGVQLVGAHYREDLVLRLSGQLEQARPWADRRPSLG